MKIIGPAPREGIKPSPTSVSALNANIFRRGGVYPLPNQNPIFYVIVIQHTAPAEHENKGTVGAQRAVPLHSHNRLISLLLDGFSISLKLLFSN